MNLETNFDLMLLSFFNNYSNYNFIFAYYIYDLFNDNYIGYYYYVPYYASFHPPPPHHRGRSLELHPHRLAGRPPSQFSLHRRLIAPPAWLAVSAASC